MTILMTTDTIGGVWNYSIDLIKELEKFNVQVVLATLGSYPTESQLNEVRMLQNVSVHCSSFKLEWMDNPWADVEKAQKWLQQLAITYNPDLIHFNNYAFDAKQFSAPAVMVGHSCVLSWWQSVKNEPAPYTWKKYSQVVKTGLQSVDMVIAPSETMMESLRENYGPLPCTQVIHNAGDSNIFHSGDKIKIVFAMGRIWDEAKNIKLLIEAAKCLSYPICIAGEAKDSLNKIRIPSNVYLLGKLNRRQIANWLSQAAVFVLPAIYEPFGLSALEAAYSGCALVLGNIPSLHEIWADNALYCSTQQPRELVDQVNRVVRDDKLREEMSRKALERSSKYNLSKMAAAYFTIYENILKQPHYTMINNKAQ